MKLKNNRNLKAKQQLFIYKKFAQSGIKQGCGGRQCRKDIKAADFRTRKPCLLK